MMSKLATHGLGMMVAAFIGAAATTPSVATSMAPIGEANPVVEAVRSGDAVRVGQAVSENPKAVTRADALGRTALHYAARLGLAEAVALLLQAGAAPDPTDNDGYTPLMRAVTSGHTAAAALLVSAGANHHRPLPDGRSLQVVARETNDPEMLELLARP